MIGRIRVKTSIEDPLSGYLVDDSKYFSNNVIYTETEQQSAKSEIVNYMGIADNHLFLVGDDSNGWVEHKVLVEGNYYICITGTVINIYEIKLTVDTVWAKNFSAYGGISVVKNKMFSKPRKGKQIKAVKNYQAAKDKYAAIANAIKGKTNKIDIWRTINGLLNP